MKILLSCQFSPGLRDKFRALGHDAWSNDLIPSEGDNTFHIQDDAVKVAYGQSWDLMIAMPPCTYLTLSGVRWLFDDARYPDRWSDMERGAIFYNRLLNAPIERICMENPVMHSYASSRIDWRGEMQYVHPHYFSSTTSKKTGLRLVNLPKLTRLQHVPKEMWTYEIHRMAPGPNRQHERSRTFVGIEDGMVAAWGNL